MQERTVHRVDGVGRPVKPVKEEFNPEAFEQAIHGLQQIILDVARFSHEKPDGDYTPGHEHETVDGEEIIRIQSDTILYDVWNIIPRRWDMSVLTDLVHENSYYVRTSVDCGGGVVVFANIRVEGGWAARVTVGHNRISNPDEIEKVGDIDNHSSSREITHLNRYLERSVMQGYAKTITNSAPAFDYIATKEDIPPTGGRPKSIRERRESHTQKEWADVRGKTQQTVSDNVREARGMISGLPESKDNSKRRSALEQLDSDEEYQSGDIRLV